MNDINTWLMPLWNLSPQAPGGIVLLAMLSSRYLSTVAILGMVAMLCMGGAWRRAALQMLAAMGLAWLVARGIHTYWPQPRPFVLGIGTHWVEHSGSASFPSRHATVGLAFAFVGLLSVPRRSVALACLTMGLLVAWSRVALGAHFPMDVLAGAAIAATVALVVHLAWPRPGMAVEAQATVPFPLGAPVHPSQSFSPIEVSVLIPAKDEAGNVGPLVNEISAALNGYCTYEVVLVDDGSSDRTSVDFIEHCRDRGVRAQLLRHACSCGQSTALATAARHAQGRYLITIDGDGQNDPADIPALVADARRMALANADFCIAGYRRNRRDTRWKKFQSKVANAIRRRVLDDGVPDTGCGLKLIPRQTWQHLPYFDHMHRFIPALVQRMGGRISVVPVNHRHRRTGVSKYTAWNRLWVGIVDMLGVRWLMLRSKRAALISREFIDGSTL